MSLRAGGVPLPQNLSAANGPRRQLALGGTRVSHKLFQTGASLTHAELTYAWIRTMASGSGAVLPVRGPKALVRVDMLTLRVSAISRSFLP